MAITQAIANSFKKELLDGDHDFTAAPSGDIFKIALYTSSATLNSATTSLLTSSPTNEVPNSGQYTACLLYTSPSPRDRTRSRMPSSA